MRYFLLFTVCIFCFSLPAQQWMWAIQTKSGKMAADSAGNVFVLADSTLKRFNTNGQPVWEKQLSGAFTVRNISAEKKGNVYLAIIFSKLKIAGQTFESASGYDAVLVKLDASGNFVWSINKTHVFNDYISDVFIDNNDRVYICGGHNTSQDTINMFYIEHYSPEGQLLMTKTFEGGQSWEIATDHAGTIYLLGGIVFLDYAIIGSLQVGPGDYHGSHFIASFNEDGNVLWAQSLGGNYYTPHVNLGVDTEGSIYLTKWGRYSGFSLRKWNKQGVHQWNVWKNSVYGDCNALTIDNNGKIWLTGNLWMGPDDPQQFLWKYDKDGNEEESLTNYADGYEIAHDYYNNIYVSGYLYDTAMFGNTTLNPANGNNFLAKLNGRKVNADFITENPLCENQEIVFQNTSLNDTAAYWEFDGGTPATSTNISDTIYFDEPGTHTVRLIAYNSFSSDTIIKIITVNAKPLPPLITQSENTLQSSYSSGNQWLYENAEIPKATASSYDITLEGNYSVVYTDTNGCFSQSQQHHANFYQISENAAPQIATWNKRLHYTKYNQATDIITTNDQGYAMAALTYGNNRLESSVIKFSAEGQVQWSRVIDPETRPKQILQMPDGSYALLADAGAAINIIRLNANGEVTGSKSYNITKWGLSSKWFDRTADGGFIIQAFFHSETSPFYRTYILKVNAAGNIQWSKTFEVQGFAGVGSIKQTADGGYIMNGYGSFPCCTPQHYICKLGADGLVTWIREFQGATFEHPANIIELGDGYIMAGTTKEGLSSSADVYILKTDLNGNLQWSKTYGTVYNEEAKAILKVQDGFIVSGRTGSFNNGWNVYLLKVDVNGNEIWSRSYGGPKDESGLAITPAADGGLVIGGVYGGTYDWSEGDIYFFKTDALGHSGCNEKIVWTKTNDYNPPTYTFMPQINGGGYIDTLAFTSVPISFSDSVFCTFSGTLDISEVDLHSNQLLVFPNPSEGKIFVESAETIKTIRVYNLLGEKVFERKVSAGYIEIDLSRFRGNYFLEAETERQLIRQKLILTD